MNGKAAVLRLAFRSWWLSGTGGGRGRHLDAVCHRDADGLPAMPMSQVKGTLRETAQRLADAGRAGWCDAVVNRLFGARTEGGATSFDGAVAFLGDAEMSATDREGLVGLEPEARRCRGTLYRRIAATSVDDLGVAADRSLRYVEAAKPVNLSGRLEWIAADPPDCEWIALLDAACAATLAFGKLKLDGYGAAIASVVPAPARAAPTRSAADFRENLRTEHRVCVLLTQTRPAIFSRSAATEGAHTTLDAPTGGSLLGWAVAAGGYDSFEDPFRVFHSGAVRFGNAASLAPDHTVCVPTPKLFMAPKHDAGGGEADGRVGSEVRIGRPVAGGQDESGTNGTGTRDATIQYEHAPAAPFITPAGHVVRPARGQRLRTATKGGRAAEGRLFGYEHLSGEARPVFVAMIERDKNVSDADWSRLLDAFDGRTARLGRARGTSYGGEYVCRLAPAPCDPAPIPQGTTGRLRVLALSDLALVDEFGVPSAVPDHKMLGLPSASFVGDDSAMSLRRHAPWNRKLQTRDMERQTIEAGSVLSFDAHVPLAQDLPARAAVGLWREAGFGQIWIAPSFLRGEAPSFDGNGEHHAYHDARDGSGASSVEENGETIEPPDGTRNVGSAREDTRPSARTDAMPAHRESKAGESRTPGTEATASGDESGRKDDRLHIGRVTFEACSPLSIGSGERGTEKRKERGSDEATNISVAEIQRDANGLPTIPGPGLQGVLRRLAEEVYGKEFAREMFGFEGVGDDGAAARVLCGWACAHDANGDAVSGLRPCGLDTSDDEVLRLLKRREPLWRDHVALNDRHSVDQRRKFARAAVPVGARFSLELSGWGGDGFRDDLKKIVGLLRHPRFRLGAGSARGYGRIRLLAASHEVPSLDDARALRELRGQAPSASLPTKWYGEESESGVVPWECNDGDTVLTLSLECTDLLRTGAAGPHARSLTHDAHRARSVESGKVVGSVGLGNPEPEGENAILMLLREPRIVWDGNRGRAVEICDDPAANPEEQLRFPIPGSSIRGPLAHRMLFHANRLAGRCIDADAWLEKTEEERQALEKTYEGHARRDPALIEFLGTVKESGESEDSGGGSGQAGRILFDDAEVRDVQWIVGVDHVSIDRFTGGARTGALFREEALLGGRIEVTATIRPPRKSVDGAIKTIGGWPEPTAKAFLLAVRDLCTGRLVLGGREHGECSGKACFQGHSADDWHETAENAGVPIGGKGA